MSNSIITDAANYVGTRILSWRIVALCVLLPAALLVSAATMPSPDSLIRQAGFLLIAIFTFRLWDDLADLPYDRLHHPRRTLVAADKLAPFAIAVIAGLASLAYLLRHDSRRLAVLLLLTMLLALLYHSPPGKQVVRSLRAGLVLVKYPVFLFLAGSQTFRAWVCAVLVYLLLAACERHDDRALRGAATFPFVAGIAVGVALVSVLYFSRGVLS